MSGLLLADMCGLVLGIINLDGCARFEKGSTMSDSEKKKEERGSETGLIEKAFLMGLGATSVAREKAEELADELIKRGQMTKTESEGFVGRLANKADETTNSLGKTVAKETAKVVEGMGLASKKDIARLEAELTEIKALIAQSRPRADEPDGQ